MNNSFKEQAAEFLAIAGLLIIRADYAITAEEIVRLQKILSNFTDRSINIHDEKDLLERAENICSNWEHSDDDQKGVLFGILIGLAIADGELHEGELDVLFMLAKILKIGQISNQNSINTFLDSKEKTAEFIAAAGSYIIGVDGHASSKEKDLLVSALTNFTTEPLSYLGLNNELNHRARTEKICAYWANEENILVKYCLLGIIIGLAVADDVIYEKEKKALNQIAKWMNVNDNIINVVLNVSSIRV